MRNVNFLGLAVCGVCAVVSLAFAVEYGLTLSPDPFISLAYSSIGVAAVLWEIVGWHRAAHLYRVGRTWAGRVCVIGLMLSTVITVQYELGFLAMLFETKASAGSADASARASLENERAVLTAQIAKAGGVRPVEAIRGDLEGMKALQTQADEARIAADVEEKQKGCGDRCKAHRTTYTQLATKIAASPIDKLQAELGTALGIERAQARVREITEALRPLASSGVADARATYMHMVFGLSETGARLTLSLLIILFLLAGRSFAPFTFMDPKAPAELRGTAIDNEQWAHALVARAAGGAGAGAQYFPPASANPETLALASPSPFIDADEVDEREPGEDEDDLPAFDLDELDMLEEFQRGRESLDVAPGSPEAPSAATVAPEKPLSAAESRRIALVRRFILDCCIVYGDDHSEREPAAVIQSAFRQWQTDNEIGDIVNSNDFGDTFTTILTDLGGAKIHSNGKKYVGVKLKPYVTHRLAQAEAQPAEPVETGALGANGRARRAAIASGEFLGARGA